MPDYNRAATTYWWLATVCGHLLLLWCLARVAMSPPAAIVQTLAGALLAIGAGLYPVRVPGTRVAFVAGEVCIFLVMLLHGPEAAAVAAAGEAAMGSFRVSKRATSRIGSPAMATLAMFAAASIFAAGRAALGRNGIDGAAPLLALAMGVGLVYFLFSATLMSGAARLRRGERLLQLADVVSVFRWVGLAYAASAAVSTLLYLVYRQAGLPVLLVMLPLLAMLLLVLHYYFREQEAREALERVIAEAAEREAALQTREAEAAARHQRELQFSERRFHSAFTYASIGMALLDLDGRVLRSNEAMAKLLGRQLDDLVGVEFAALIDAADVADFRAKLAKARGVDFEDFALELRVLVASGATRWLQVDCSFFRGPATHGAAQAGKPCLILQAQARRQLASA